MYLAPQFAGGRRTVHFGGPTPQLRRHRVRGAYAGVGMMVLLGDLTMPSIDGTESNAQLLQKVMAANPSPTWWSNTTPDTSLYGTLVDGINNGRLWSYLPGSTVCNTYGTSPVAATVTGSAGSIALKLAPATGPAAPFVALAGGILSLFSAIFAHHQQAVKNENSTLCALNSTVNSALDALDQAVTGGQITPAQGIQAASAMPGQYIGQVQGILKMDPNNNQCNAACFESVAVLGCCAAAVRRYTAQAATAPAASGSTAAGTTPALSTSGIPSWAWLLGLGVLALKVL